MTVAVCVDNSEASLDALRHAARRASELETSLRVIHVAENEVFHSNGTVFQESDNSAEEAGQEVLRRSDSILEDFSVTHEKVLLQGEPIQEVVEYLEDSDDSCVCIGHRNLNERAEAAFGSFAKTLIEQSPVPVTVVRKNIV